MFKKILVANRGEIAVRIIRACKELGIATVAIYSEADRQSLHVKLADEAFCVGPGAALGSYLNVPNVIGAAVVSQCDAVHPGYGFLAENAQFVRMCAEQGLTFIGPSAESMMMMGDKAEARRAVVAVDVPLLPGTEELQDFQEAQAFADKHGYPIMIKASAGGGGKGMRVAREASEFESLFRMAQNEARSSFNDDRVYCEKFLDRARHVEIQIMADSHRNVVHLGERDCSMQRRNQKLVEESPCPVLDEETRQAMGQAAVRASLAAKYVGAGTVEFLFDESTKEFYFLEMNTRIQVEHPVTEMVTSTDLVKEQIKVAAGLPLSWKQEDVELRGHAIECRINAERPEKGFIPSVGTIKKLHFPGGPGVRIDTFLRSGDKVEPYYDSMVAKIITWGVDREEALARMRRCLDELKVKGIHTTAAFQRALMDDEGFLSGAFWTTYIEKVFVDRYQSELKR